MAEARQLRIDQWALLRHLLGGPMTEGQLATGLSRAAWSVARSLGTLRKAGLVEFKQEREHATRNRPKGRWSLTARGQEVAWKAPDAISPDRTVQAGLDEDAASTPRAPTLEQSQGFVRATVQSRQVPALLDVLASGEQALEASFVARLDGDRHDYLFVFDRRLGARPPEVLSAALQAAHLPFATGIVADVRPFDQFVGDARAARQAARRVWRRQAEGSSGKAGPKET